MTVANPSKGEHTFSFYLLLICVICVICGHSASTAAQRRPPHKRSPVESPPQPQVTFDTLLAADSYKIYGEVRGVGQLIRSDGAKDLLDPVIKLAAPPKEFRSLVEWLNAGADSLTGSRLLFAGWPSRTGLPQVLVAIEFSTAEDAQKFVPQLRAFLPKLLPAPTPASTTGANDPGRNQGTKQPEKASAAPYVLKQVGSLVLISNSPFNLKDLKPQGSKLLTEDQNFRIAHDRFSSESLFLYVDFAALNREEAERRRQMDIAYKRMEAEAATHPEVEVTPSPEGEIKVAEAQATRPEVNDTFTVTEMMRQPSAEQPDFLNTALVSLSGSFFGGRPKWPDVIGASLVFDGDSYVARVLLLDSNDEKGTPIPFFPQLVPGPALSPESPSVLPADSELFVAASLDFQQAYEAIIDTWKTQIEETRKYQPKSVTFTEPDSPFDTLEKRLKIKIKDDLLPLIGNELAVTIPVKVLDVGNQAPSDSQPTSTDNPEKPREPSPVFALSVKDREGVKALIPRILDSLGLKAAGLLANVEKHDDTELVSYGNVVSYAFIGNFLIVSTDPAAVRHVVDSYLNHETLSSSAHFRSYTRWQPKQVWCQVYVSPALMESYNQFAREAQISDQLRDFLMLLSPVPQPVTYAIYNEGVGPLHEIHVPRNLVMMMLAGISSTPVNAPITTNEANIQQTLRTLASAESTFQSTMGAGRFGSMDELIKAGLISSDLGNNSGYTVELIVSNSRFEISAVPTEYGKTGKRSFFLDESSVLRAADHGGGAATIADKPAQ